MTATDESIDRSGVFLLSNGIVTLNDQQLRCHSIKTNYILDQIPVAEIVVIPNYVTDQQEGAEEPVRANAQEPPNMPVSSREIYDFLFGTNKGDTLTVTFNVTAPAPDMENGKPLAQELVKMFTGVLLGWAPTWINPKTFRMTIWAIHPLGMLDWSSSIIDKVHGSGFDDYKIPTVYAPGQELVPYMKGPYDPTEVAKDLWKNLIKPELICICRSTRFDGVNAEKVVEYLENDNFDGSELQLKWQLEDPVSAIIDIRRTLLQGGVGRHTLWDNLVEVAAKYKFSLICRPNDYSIAPALPAIGGYPKLTLLWQQYAKREEFNALARNITQSIGVLRGPGGLSSFFDIQGRRLQQEFRERMDDGITAGVSYSHIPAYLDFIYNPFQWTGRTLGLKEERLYASGYCLSGEAEDVATLNVRYNQLKEDGLSKYTDVLMNDESYDGSNALFRGNVDFNVSPGSMVKIEAPMYRVENAEETAKAYYARAWGVTLVLDPAAKTSGTYLVLSHVRTQDEQDAIELMTHPMYDGRWVSAPLIPISGYTMEPDNA